MRNRRARRRFTALAAAAVALAAVPATTALAEAPASQAARQQRFAFAIAAKPLAEALAEFRAITGLAVAVPPEATTRRSRAVRGRLTANQALATMTAGTGVRLGAVEMQASGRGEPVPTIVVEAPAGSGGVVGYLATRSTTATRTDTPLQNVPQSITVVPRQLLTDTDARSIADAVRYVPGVTVAQGEGNRDALVIRGQATTADFFVDGVRDDVQYYRDFYNVDRLEVLRGPNAMIFGRGGGGGVVNRVMNQADWRRHAEVQVSGGMFGFGRTQFDLGNGVNENVAVRLNGMFERSNSYRDGVESMRYAINPQIAFRPSESTTIKLSYEYYHDDRTADRGVPSYQGRPFFQAPRWMFFGNPNDSFTYANVHNATAIIEHETEGGVRIRNYTRFSDYQKFYQNIFPGAVNANGTMVAISAYNNYTGRQNVINQTDVNFRFRTGPLEHRMLVGVDAGIQNTTNFRNTGYFNNTTTSVSVPTSNPFAWQPVTFRQQASDADARSRLRYASAYVQDQIEITRHLQIIAGLRFDRFDLDYFNNRNGQSLSRTDDLVSPRLGVVVKPVDQLSLYASYSVSYLPYSGEQFGSLDTTTQALRPERFDNYEVGVKYEILPRLMLTAALYQLDRRNTRTPDPNNPGFTVQTGSTRTRGFELGINGYVTDRWQIAGGYAYQDAFISSTTSAAPAGNRVALVPRHSFSLWNKYQFTDTWGAGIGVIHQTDMFAGADNAVRLPGYTRVDAAVFVRLSENLRAQVNMENLFDAKYYPTAHSNNNIMPGAPRMVRLTLTGTF